jgi:hypothetical protein
VPARECPAAAGGYVRALILFGSGSEATLAPRVFPAGSLLAAALGVAGPTASRLDAASRRPSQLVRGAPIAASTSSCNPNS